MTPMEHGEVLFVSGSPSGRSRSAALARVVAGRFEARGLAVRSYGLRDFDAADVLLARTDAPTVGPFLASARAACAVVLSTPVYKATYSGALKAIVDLLPPDALAGKPMLGIGTTKLEAHGRALEAAFRDLFAFFRAGVTASIIALDEEVTIDDAGAKLTEQAAARLSAAADAVASAALGGAR